MKGYGELMHFRCGEKVFMGNVLGWVEIKDHYGKTRKCAVLAVKRDWDPNNDILNFDFLDLDVEGYNNYELFKHPQIIREHFPREEYKFTIEYMAKLQSFTLGQLINKLDKEVK